MALTKKIFSQIGQELSGAPSHTTAARSERYGAPCIDVSFYLEGFIPLYFCSRKKQWLDLLRRNQAIFKSSNYLG